MRTASLSAKRRKTIYLYLCLRAARILGARHMTQARAVHLPGDQWQWPILDGTKPIILPISEQASQINGLF